MSKTKNMHFLSQSISKNFISNGTSNTFLQYNPISKNTKPVNIKKLFSRKHIWSQEFEEILSGNNYENKLAPILKELATREMERGARFTGEDVQMAQFNAAPICDAEQKQLLDKLIFQTVLLQMSNGVSDGAQMQEVLKEVYTHGIQLPLNLLLVEVNPLGHYPPLILTDGMLFHFLAPDLQKQSLGHVCFMFPISEQRFLLWVSQLQDYYFFCQKYADINFLNLSRVEQHDKKCKIALHKNERNEKYLKDLIVQIETFSSGERVAIRSAREANDL